MTSVGGSRRRSLPSGTVTLLFSDIEGSTRLVQDLGDRYPVLLETHRTLLRSAWADHDGVEVGTEGDSFFVAFEHPADAVAAARRAQQLLVAYDWPDDGVVRVRMGMHTGEVEIAGDDYAGLAVHLAARVASAAHGGQVLLSDATRLFVEAVDGIDLMDHGEHRLKDIRRPVQIFQLLDDALPATFPPLRSMSAAPTNLPAPVDDFIGRTKEIEEITAALAASRLVTLTGPGGAGKTRLSLEVAAALASSIAGGTWLVELAVTTDADRIDTLVAAAVGVSEQPGRTLRESLVDQLRDRSMLLVLDNCEHLIDGAASLAADLLSAAPGLRILASSRERLGVRGERVVPIPPMEVSADEPEASDAVLLFVARARAVLSTFEPDLCAMQTIAAICQRLDGLPLAIELAAARTRVLPIEQLHERLDDRFRVLAASERHAPSRQRTLGAVVAWSYDLLPSDEQALFRGLSVFPDSFTLQAVESVGAAAGLDCFELLDLLTALVDKSLVSVTHADGSVTRYQLLETLRAFGWARLGDAGELDGWRNALGHWVVEQVAVLEAAMRTPAQDEALRRARLELAHAAAALDWMLERGDDLAALRTVSAIPVGLPSARIELIETLLDRVPNISHVIAGQALLTCSNLEADRGASEGALRAAHAAEAHFEQAGDATHATWARFFQITPAWSAGDLERVEDLCERVVQEFENSGSRLGIAYASWLGSLRASDPIRATELAAAAVAEFRSMGAEVGLAHALESRALIAVRADRPLEAIPFIAESLDLFVKSGNTGCTAHSLEAAAACLVRVGSLADVAELIGAAEAFREATGHAHRPWEVGGTEDVQSALREGDATIDAARSTGRSRSLMLAAERAAGLLAALEAQLRA